jgi:trehalose 6-phosphate phosphatase
MDVAAPSPTLHLRDYAILLDVDGTILDLASSPREVFCPPFLRKTLNRLYELTGGAVALVSGRSIDDLDLIFAPLQLAAVGGHGAEFRPFPGGEIDRRRALPLDKNLKRELATVGALGPGILIEDKGFSLAIHYRLAPDKEALVRALVDRICACHPAENIDVLPGKFVVEIKPAGFDKGKAVLELMTYPPFTGRNPIFIGDDTTDEAVFAIIPDLAGLAFSVGRDVPGVNGVFSTPASVRRWLDRITRDGVSLTHD